jgi:hypothetical protein
MDASRRAQPRRHMTHGRDGQRPPAPRHHYLDKNPRGYCPNHATGVKLPDDFVVTPLQYVD